MDQPPVCSYEGSDYQETFWDQGGRAYEDAVEGVALKRLLPSHGKLMLELGAGAGRNSPRYAGFERVVLVDYARTQLERARDRLGNDPHYIYVAADVYRLPFVDGLFDCATMIRTLHHLIEPHRALDQVCATLEPGAVFILEFANKRNAKAILRYTLRRQDWNPFTPDTISTFDLYYNFHPDAVRSWLQSSGFAIERTLTVSHLRANALKRHVPLKLLVGIELAPPAHRQPGPTDAERVRALARPAWPERSGRAARAARQREPGSFFRCPGCGQPLADTPPLLVCDACGRTYPVEGGIYDMRLKED